MSDHAEIGAVHHGLLLGARADGPAGRYWLYLLVRPEAPLASLDASLREIWFETDGAPSVFEIEGTRYVSTLEEGDRVEPSDGDEDGEEEEAPPIEAMSVDMGATIRPRMEFRYLYDPQDPTEVEFTVYDPYPVPATLVDEESEADVVVLAKNALEGEEVTCSSCDNSPSYVCLGCAEADEPEIGPFVCEECVEKHDEHEEYEGELVELVNTPYQ